MVGNECGWVGRMIKLKINQDYCILVENIIFQSSYKPLSKNFNNNKN